MQLEFSPRDFIGDDFGLLTNISSPNTNVIIVTREVDQNLTRYLANLENGDLAHSDDGVEALRPHQFKLANGQNLNWNIPKAIDVPGVEFLIGDLIQTCDAMNVIFPGIQFHDEPVSDQYSEDRFSTIKFQPQSRAARDYHRFATIPEDRLKEFAGALHVDSSDKGFKDSVKPFTAIIDYFGPKTRYAPAKDYMAIIDAAKKLPISNKTISKFTQTYTGCREFPHLGIGLFARKYLEETSHSVSGSHYVTAIHGSNLPDEKARARLITVIRGSIPLRLGC